MRQQAVEVAAAFLDDLGQADDLGARAHDDQQLQAAVVFKLDIWILIQFKSPINVHRTLHPATSH